MLRWLILSAAVVLWLGSMALVYTNFKPVPTPGMNVDTRAAIDRLFDDDKPLTKSWRLYTDAADLERVKSMFGVSEPQAQPLPKFDWDGVDEHNLLAAGKLRSDILNKRASSLGERTRLTLKIPGTPFEASYEGTGHFSMDNGLEYSRSTLKLKFVDQEIEARTSGNRDGTVFNFTTVMTHNQVPLFNQTRREEVGGKVAPNAELAPFQFNPAIKVGETWDVRMVDLNLAMKGEKEFMRVFKVKCIGQRKIMMEKNEVVSFEVRSENGEARAWYSTDGEVLKQQYKLMGMLDVMVVADDDAFKAK